ncbi:hypothetical protein NPX13_g1213 [Xylaria arbuscula]|uniref:DUF6604 domain-containing protein n=1 Tax=Xylaria arbuscula TaxID=114810 RepID=A0A9W8NMV1_9PEZI|nr:hypothetical protein NPX13_g1213 [Xylaria arbuscula]
MASLDLYLAYKRDTSRLIYWIVQASNAIVTSPVTLPDDVPRNPNTDGQITVSSLVSLSKLIAKHIDSIPEAILALFRSVIQARKAVYEKFQQLVAHDSDSEIERSNASHKYFIDALVEAFEALGGVAWAEKFKSDGPPPNYQADLDQTLFANKFSVLRNEGDTVLGGNDSSEDKSDLESHQYQASQRQKQRSSCKEKKTKHVKKTKKKKMGHLRASTTQGLDDVSVENYRIIQDEQGIMIDYWMAAEALLYEWARLRDHLQGLWHDVAYSSLNSAIAGAVSKTAIKMVECSANAVFVDFPGRDSYETVMNTITFGGPDKIQVNIRVAVHHMSLDYIHSGKVQETVLDVKELFLIYVYQDLIDFVTDFQKTRSGKPTKRMQSQIRNWDPNLDLQRATKTERLVWRRSYTINWLYDLVNIFSSIVVQRNNLRGENHMLESVDWSTAGPWDKCRELFGLSEFAGMITHLAMQKPGSDIRSKIMPHRVFHLQYIVDSFTISRGWSLPQFRDHILEAPPHDFRPQRDIDLFLDRDQKRPGSGFYEAVGLLEYTVSKRGSTHGDSDWYRASCKRLQALEFNLIDWLGESGHMPVLTNAPPSRFSSSTNYDGIWKHSPFLCGVGLEEGLREACWHSFMLLDELPEPLLLVHLHNMLVQKGYIAEPIHLYAKFQALFETSLFVDGKVPTSHFYKALRTRAIKLYLLHPSAQQTVKDMKKHMNNYIFNTKPLLILCNEAGWDPDRIPDNALPMPSRLAAHRAAQAKPITDPITGQKRLDETDLVKGLKACGISDEVLIRHQTASSLHSNNLQNAIESKGHSSGEVCDPYSVGAHPGMGDGQGTLKGLGAHLLRMLEEDITADFHGHRPICSLNFIWVMAHFLVLFGQFEDELEKLRNPVYEQVYGSDLPLNQKRAIFVFHVLQLQDEECLRVMARKFQNPGADFRYHVYWEDLKPKRPREEETLIAIDDGEGYNTVILTMDKNVAS